MRDWLLTWSRVLAFFLRAMSILLLITIFLALSGDTGPYTPGQINGLIIAWIVVWIIVEVVYYQSRKRPRRR